MPARRSVTVDSRITKAKVSKKGPPKAATQQYVRKLLEKMVEAKSYTFHLGYLGSPVGVNNAASGSFSTNQTAPLTPYTGYVAITQGTTESSRIGNAIKVRKAMLKMVFSPADYDLTTNPAIIPQIIQIYIWRPTAQYNDLGGARSIATGDFFDQNASSIGFASTFRDLLLPPNNSLLTVYKKVTIKIGNGQNGGTGAVPGDAYYNNNDFNYSKIVELDVTKWYPKTLTFNDNTAITSNEALYFTVCPLNADGTAPVAAYMQTEWDFSIKLDYTDA